MSGDRAPRGGTDSLTRIVVTGSECTGKTTLTRELALALDTVWVGEFARAYAEERGGSLGTSDVEPIARGQMLAEDAGASRAWSARRSILVLDTDLVSTCVYARHYYGACPGWIEEEARRRRASLYLLCDIDLPWIADPLRDRPFHRAGIHASFADALGALDVRTALIRGVGPDRLARALAAVRHAIGTGTGPPV